MKKTSLTTDFTNFQVSRQVGGSELSAATTYKVSETTKCKTSKKIKEINPDFLDVKKKNAKEKTGGDNFKSRTQEIQ